MLCSISQIKLHHAFTDIEMDKGQNMKDTFDKLCELIKKPRNYGSTPEEKAEETRLIQEDEVLIVVKQFHVYR